MGAGPPFRPAPRRVGRTNGGGGLSPPADRDLQWGGGASLAAAAGAAVTPPFQKRGATGWARPPRPGHLQVVAPSRCRRAGPPAADRFARRHGARPRRRDQVRRPCSVKRGGVRGPDRVCRAPTSKRVGPSVAPNRWPERARGRGWRATGFAWRRFKKRIKWEQRGQAGGGASRHVRGRVVATSGWAGQGAPRDPPPRSTLEGGAPRAVLPNAWDLRGSNLPAYPRAYSRAGTRSPPPVRRLWRGTVSHRGCQRTARQLRCALFSPSHRERSWASTRPCPYHGQRLDAHAVHNLVRDVLQRRTDCAMTSAIRVRQHRGRTRFGDRSKGMSDGVGECSPLGAEHSSQEVGPVGPIHTLIPSGFPLGWHCGLCLSTRNRQAGELTTSAAGRTHTAGRHWEDPP